VTNHCSYADSVFIGAILPDVHLFVAKTDLQRAPVLRTWLRRTGTIFIERFDAVQSVGEVGRLQRELAQGNSIVMFPEGTFTRATGLRAFHLGAFQVAAASGASVIPLTLRGTRSVLREGQWLLRRMPVSAVVGPTLTASLSEDRFATAVRLRDLARKEILARCGEPDFL
jgi:1-acyl-sn-glycerol-3-phosphate acyltransferase